MEKAFFRKERLEKEVTITENKIVSKKKTKLKEKGITLIALVVTIIILLILAGVAIASVTGDNGLFQRASSSRETSRGGEVKEYVSLTIGDNEMAKLMNKPVTNKAAAVQDLLSKGKLTEEEATQLETTDVITIGGIEVDFSVLNKGRKSRNNIRSSIYG